MTILEGNIMRPDNISYFTALVCFLLAVIVFVATQTYLDFTIRITLTVILVILGLVVAGVGYSQRPKENELLPPAHPPETTAEVTKPEPASASLAPTPTISAQPEKPEEIQKETKPERKPVRRRKKKA